MSEKKRRSSNSGDGRPSRSFELDESLTDINRRQYEGPFQDAVYSPLPLFRTEKLIGESEALYHLFDLIGASSQTDQNVLIQGEPGTGKNLVARTIHSQSERSENWLIVVNCALIETGDVEPILLGPSGPSSEGVFEAAAGGTVVFDHLDQLDLGAQAHLNHLLETHSFEHAPDSKSSAFDVRLLFLTTRSLPETNFRKDLYYRLNEFFIQVPPLRARSDDVLQLARHFLRQQPDRDRNRDQQSDTEKSLSQGAKTAIQRYDWPGNIRELQNAIGRAAAVSKTSTIEEDDLPPSVRESESRTEPQEETREPQEETETRDEATEESSPFFVDANGSIPEIEELKREAVKRAYKLCDGDIDRAAVELGIARSTMYRLLKRYDLK